MRNLHLPLSLVTGFILLFTISPLYGQATNHALDDDAWALQFSIGDIDLGSFAGANISAKHHTASDRAFRYGVSVSGRHEDRDNQPTRTDLLLGVETHFLSYPRLADHPDDALQFFWGIGPTAAYLLERSAPINQDAETRHRIQGGVSGTLGAEWFVTSRISLTGEYLTRLTAQYGTDMWGINTSGSVRFGTSVYF